MEFFEQYHIVIIGIIFFGVLFGMAFLTYREKKWIKQHYKTEDIIALGFGIRCYGLSSVPGNPEKLKGFLLIHKGGLLFKSRFSDTRFEIPGDAIQKAYHSNMYKGARLFRSAVMIDYRVSPQKSDTIAFKMAYPPQWIRIIGKTFMKAHP